jgi:phenylalanyl-tRNA synthetase alpha chain
MLACALLKRHVKTVARRQYTTGPKRSSPEDAKLLQSRRMHPNHNIPLHIESKVGRELHRKKGHPLNTISNIISSYFNNEYTKLQKTKLAGLEPPMTLDYAEIQHFDNLSPVVTIEQNFDELLIPADHVSRKPTDTYYVDDKTVLRCHTSAHQTELMKMKGNTAFLASGDVYRRDTVDVTHFPIFHQMEGVRIFPKHPQISEEFAVKDLKDALEGMVRALFGDVQVRWIDAYFPFTHPSFEMEIFFNGEWLEVFGCGVVQKQILSNTGHDDHLAWAFGLGLERLAMILFDIHDIRLFWSEDTRFTSQFTAGKITKFKPFSKQPACYKDISFWIPPTFHENEFFELVRQIGGVLVEDVKLIDKFVNPKTNKESHCYRLNYRSMDRNLTNEEIDELQLQVRTKSADLLKVELR